MNDKISTVLDQKSFNNISNALSHCIKEGFEKDFDGFLQKALKRNDVLHACRTCIEIGGVIGANYLGKILKSNLLNEDDKIYYLKTSINENKIECLKLLLAHPGLTVNSNIDFLSIPISRGYNEVVRILSSDNRFTIDKSAFKMAKSSGNTDALEILSSLKQHKDNHVTFKTTKKNELDYACIIHTPKPLSHPSGRLSDFKVSVISFFGESIEPIRSSLRLCDIYNNLYDKINYNFILTSENLILPRKNDLIRDSDALSKIQSVKVHRIFHLNEQRVYFPEILSIPNEKVKLQDILEAYPMLSVDEINILSREFPH